MTKRRPVVGVPACIKPIGAHDFHVVGRKYVDAVLAAGCTPVLLPALGERQDVAQLIDMLDGVMFTGSPSMVEPARYGQQPAYPDMHLDKERDATTFPLIAAALDAGLPLMAICRGFQELNVALGGTLFQAVQDVPGRIDHREPKDKSLDVQYGPAHPVNLTAGGKLQAILGGVSQIQVNSIHSQGIDALAPALTAEAVAPDGQIEAVWVTGAKSFALAVQWHPEWKVMDNPDSVKIFTAFGDACRVRQAT
ncbi:MAG: gamma-glutamyl-gamma-aminobutyrate hydrolase family protein [Rhodocyclaceae bacterium]|nr:gamma-glutamyl-gamma-aminobutyrate hydrolase family protein [Rhodocyclaceae bacterium]MBK6908401.1 gamma-glutamyl-gamma-aminobutyrate hydrolase family protein [Rhodocyclaceae bacterium]